VLAWVAAAVVVLAWRVVPSRSGPRARCGFDVGGTAAAVAGLVLLVVGAGAVEEPGSVPVPPVGMLLAGAVLLAVFVLTQRFGRDPLLGWPALTTRSFLVPNGVAFVNTATTSASGTLVALVAQDLLELGPRATGLVLMPFSILVVLGSSTGRFWLRRPRRTGMAAGLAVVAVAIAALAAATAARSTALLAVAVGVAGLGLSWAAVTSTDAATAALPPDRQATAAGAVNTAAQVGTALGVAVLLTVASVGAGDTSSARGYVVAFLAAAALAAATAGALLVGRPAEPAG
jgi:hypothetical protein